MPQKDQKFFKDRYDDALFIQNARRTIVLNDVKPITLGNALQYNIKNMGVVEGFTIILTIPVTIATAPVTLNQRGLAALLPSVVLADQYNNRRCFMSAHEIEQITFGNIRNKFGLGQISEAVSSALFSGANNTGYVTNYQTPDFNGAVGAQTIRYELYVPCCVNSYDVSPDNIDLRGIMNLNAVVGNATFTLTMPPALVSATANDNVPFLSATGTVTAGAMTVEIISHTFDLTPAGIQLPLESFKSIMYLESQPAQSSNIIANAIVNYQLPAGRDIIRTGFHYMNANQLAAGSSSAASDIAALTFRADATTNSVPLIGQRNIQNYMANMLGFSPVRGSYIWEFNPEWNIAKDRAASFDIQYGATVNSGATLKQFYMSTAPANVSLSPA